MALRSLPALRAAVQCVVLVATDWPLLLAMLQASPSDPTATGATEPMSEPRLDPKSRAQAVRILRTLAASDEHSKIMTLHIGHQEALALAANELEAPTLTPSAAAPHPPAANQEDDVLAPIDASDVVLWPTRPGHVSTRELLDRYNALAALLLELPRTADLYGRVRVSNVQFAARYVLTNIRQERA